MVKKLTIIMANARRFFHMSHRLAYGMSCCLKISSPVTGQNCVSLVRQKVKFRNSLMVNRLVAYRKALNHWIHRRNEKMLCRSVRKPLKSIISTKMKTTTIRETARIQRRKVTLLCEDLERTHTEHRYERSDKKTDRRAEHRAHEDG
jgi:hypothetical protein